jgi:hypothetical protein
MTTYHFTHGMFLLDGLFWGPVATVRQRGWLLTSFLGTIQHMVSLHVLASRGIIWVGQGSPYHMKGVNWNG